MSIGGPLRPNVAPYRPIARRTAPAAGTSWLAIGLWLGLAVEVVAQPATPTLEQYEKGKRTDDVAGTILDANNLMVSAIVAASLAAAHRTRLLNHGLGVLQPCMIDLNVPERGIDPELEVL
jgi:hypothetical protein